MGDSSFFVVPIQQVPVVPIPEAFAVFVVPAVLIPAILASTRGSSSFSGCSGLGSKEHCSSMQF